ncbi:MAG: DMT family transporter [Geminicoccaceae bacterium]|nr:DMT family transporter [Geminicoccaceae bacterium]
MTLMAGAAFGASMMNALIRHISTELHSFEIAFFRNLFGFFTLVPTALRHGGLRGTLATRRFPLHALRGVLNASAMLCFFHALSMTPLATVAALSFTAPLFATLLAIPVLKEQVGPRRWAGLIAGFGGTLLVVRPGIETFTLGAGLLLFAALMWGSALIAIKLLARTESSLTITLYATLFLTPITFSFAIFNWSWPSYHAMLVLLAIGTLGSLAQMAIAQAMHEADASLVLPLDFTKLLWACLLGYVLFDEIPDIFAIIGGTIILLSVIYIAYRERKSGT